MDALAILLVVELALLAFFYVSGSRYKQIVLTSEAVFPLAFMAHASLSLLEKLRIQRLFPKLYHQVHYRILRLYPPENAMLYTKLFIASVISAIIIMIILFTFFGVAGQDPVAFYFGCFIAPLAGFALYQDLGKKIRKRELSILLELPKLLNKILLLVNAGENVQKALTRVVESEKENADNPLYVELSKTVYELKLNRSFAESLEDFSKRCGVQEVTVFVTTLLLNYRRGGSDLALSMRGLSKELWDKRKTLSRTLGEEASSKLVFPLVLIFLIVMVIVAFPAISIMSN